MAHVFFSIILLMATQAFAQQVPDSTFLSVMPAPNAHAVVKKEVKRARKKRVPAQATPSPAVATPPSSQTLKPAPSDQSFGEKFRDVMLGGNPNTANKQRDGLDENDIRKNIFDFSIAPQYFYDQSQSNYFFRNYLESAPGLSLGLSLWLTPYFGTTVDYRFSILGSIKDSPTAESFVSGDQSWLGVGFKWRRFFKESAASPSFEVSVKYTDHQLNVPATSTSRMKLRTRGPDVGFTLTVPSSESMAWSAGVDFLPFLSHDELLSTTDLRTGTGNQAVGMGLNMGGEYRMTRNTRLFFKTSAILYRYQFSGTSQANDPTTGMPATNASVTDVFYFLDIGFIFGR